MGLRFIHLADVHLGYEQYGCAERCFDFALAFQRVTDQAIAQRVDFVVLAGDLFHKNVIKPRTLLQATRQLQRLHDAGIPIIAVQGNHEQPHYQDRYSWLYYLADARLLTLLATTYADQQLTLTPWDAAKCAGGYIDLPGGVRVIGCAYAGSSTARIVEALPAAFAALPGPRPAYTLLMLHAGLEGVLPGYSGGLTRAQLNPLRNYVDYLALGHIHKPFEQDDWIYNPGSLETNSTEEAAWADRGYYSVELDDARPRRHRASRVISPRRRFVRLKLEVDTCLTPEALYEALAAQLADEPRPLDGQTQPVVELRLRGVLSFPHAEVDTARLESITAQALNPLVWRLQDESSAPGELPAPPDGLSAAELERQVLSGLAERDLRYRGQGDLWADMLVHIKQMALARSAPESIVEELRAFQHALGAEESSC